MKPSAGAVATPHLAVGTAGLLGLGLAGAGSPSSPHPHSPAPGGVAGEQRLVLVVGNPVQLARPAGEGFTLDQSLHPWSRCTSNNKARSPSPWACLSSSLKLNSYQKLQIRTFHILNGFLASLEKPEG